MRRGIYGLVGISIGLILYIFMYTNTPEIKDVELMGYQQPNFDGQDLRDVRGGITSFFENGTYHINTMEYEAYQNREIIKYGKENPMFYYIYNPPAPEPEPEETSVSQASGINTLNNDGLGVGSNEPIDLINGEMTMGFNTETRKFEEENIAIQLYAFSAIGKLPVDLEYYKVTSPFGVRKDPFDQKEAFHSGLDLSGTGFEGANIYSIAPGKVLEIKEMNEEETNKERSKRGYGNYVVIEHDNGYKSLYAHLSSFSDIEVGDKIPAGEVIGQGGNTGRSTGPHLHLEIIVDDSVTVDPLLFLNRIRKVD